MATVLPKHPHSTGRAPREHAESRARGSKETLYETDRLIAVCSCHCRRGCRCPGPIIYSTDVKPEPQTAKEVRGASPYLEIKNEPSPKLIVDAPLPDLLDQGVVWIQWRVENVHIVPVFGKGALNVSPRVGHLHVQVDDLPWLWADASNINTIDLAGMPPGPHKILIELVNANHEVFPGQSKTVTFTVPKGASHAH